MYHAYSDEVLRETLHLPPHLRLTQREAYHLFHVLTPAERDEFIAQYDEALEQAERAGLVRKPLPPPQRYIPSGEGSL